MSFYPSDEENQSTKRLNVRIPRVQYERLVKYGKLLGLEGDTAVIRYFLSFAMQQSAPQFSTLLMQEENAGKLASVVALLETAKIAEK